MLFSEKFRASHPSVAFPSGEPAIELEFSDTSEVISCLQTDSEGNVIGLPPEEAVSLRWKYITTLRSESGFVDIAVRYDPPSNEPPIVIGILMTKVEAVRAVMSDEAKKSVAQSEATHFIYTPANCVIEYKQEFSFIHPKELGIELDYPTSET